MQRVAIIGGGVGGLATACLLAKGGCRVTLYEQHGQLGGRAGSLRASGFTFDTGPSWLLMPEVFAHFFERLGESLAQHLQLTTLTPSYRLVYADGASLTMSPDLKQNMAAFERLSPGAGQQLARYHAKTEHLYQTVMQHFLYENYQQPRQLLAKLLHLPGLPWHASLQAQVGRSFRDERLQQALLLPSLFLGTPPSRTPAVYGMLNYAMLTGVCYPQGGLYTLVQALEKIGTRLGVRFVTNAAVDAIAVHDGRATGVVVNGHEQAADVVISNAGLYQTEMQLLPSRLRAHNSRWWRGRQWAPSAILLYLGVDRRYPQLAHHNLVVSGDWHADIDTMFTGHDFPQDPSLYVCAPSRSDPTVAPPGCENLFVLAPLPIGLRCRADQLQAYGDTVITAIQQRLGLADLRKHVVVRRSFAAQDFTDRFGTPYGSALGLSHTLRQSALWRQSAASTTVKNLYFVGADAQPGIGLPSVLISAELLADRLLPAENAEGNDVNQDHPAAQ